MRTQFSSGLGFAGLAVGIEISDKTWLLSFLGPGRSQPRFKSVRAGDLKQTLEAIERAKTAFRLAADAPVESCYEAGREGFWIHRWLESAGIRNHVIHSASIEVTRESRQRKTDRIDAEKLVRLLWRFLQQDASLRWTEIRVPPPEIEDARHESRERDHLVREKTRLTNEVACRLRTQGVRGVDPYRADFTQIRDWRGQPLGPQLLAMLARKQQLLRLVIEQLKGLEAARRVRLEDPADDIARRARLLEGLRAIGPTTAFTLSQELGWRDFKNRREIAGLVGLGGTPWESGKLRRDQGVSGGIPRIRSLMVEIAWLWIKHQPHSALSRWFQEHFGRAGKKRKAGIVAVARRLLIALWRLWSFGEVPEGAEFKPTFA